MTAGEGPRHERTESAREKNMEKAAKDLGVGHGTDGSYPEEEAGKTETKPATGGTNSTVVTGRNEPVR